MESAAQHIGVLADYARQVVREYLQTQSDQPEDDEGKMWQGFRVSSKIVARQFRQSNPELFGEEVYRAQERRIAALRQWLAAPPEALMPLAELALLFDLSVDDVEIFIMAAAPAIDPQVEQLYAYVRNDVHKKAADVGFLCQMLSMGQQERFENLLARCAFDKPLRRQRLCIVERRLGSDENLELNLTNRRMRAADRVLDFLRFGRSEETPAVDESLAAVCVRLRDRVEIDSLGLPDYGREALLQLARTRTLPVLFTGPVGAGKQRAAEALAGPVKRGLLFADLTALLNETPDVLEVRLNEIFREARLGGDLVYFQGHSLPGEISGPTQLVLDRALKSEAVALGIDHMPVWGAGLTVGWPVIAIPLPDADSRIVMWEQCFTGERQQPSTESTVAVARRYQLSATQIRQAAIEARRLAQVGRRRRIELSDLDRACRTHFAHQLSELAQLIPVTTFSTKDLILPKEEKIKFEEILLYAAQAESIFAEWGFSEKFPYGRGLSTLFYGPPGTGKTMGAVIIAGALGLDLFRVDLSRILSRYVGETEKNLARVFDEAERGKVMLLFDEADSLFTKRTDVQTSVDRYANLEVAYLLQRMENFEGITVLTTNVEHLLDDAFKRRLRYRIYFPMPDAELRAELWRSMLPKRAPIVPNIPFELLGKQFEVSGGHIKQAVLRAAVYARRDDQPIGLSQLVEAALAECKELGMLMSDKMPPKLAAALKEEQQRLGRAPAPKAKTTKAKTPAPAAPAAPETAATGA